MAYKPQTTSNVRRILCCPEEDLFWTRINAAEKYLQERYVETDIASVKADPMFWDWWLRLWEIHDKKWISAMEKSKTDHRLVDYEWFHFYHAIKYKMDTKWETKIIKQSKQIQYVK